MSARDCKYSRINEESFGNAIAEYLEAHRMWNNLEIPSEAVIGTSKENMMEEWTPFKAWYPVIMASIWLLPLLAVLLMAAIAAVILLLKSKK